MEELRRAYDYIIGGLLCALGRHSWYEFEIPHANCNGVDYMRRCKRCDILQCVGGIIHIRKTDKCPDK